MAKQTKQIKARFGEQALGSGLVRDHVIAAAVQSGSATPATIAARSGIPESTVAEIAKQTRLPTRVVEEVKQALPAKLFTLADACVDRLLDESRLDELSGSELVKVMTHAIHNARLLMGESTQNVFSLSAVVSRINQANGNTPPEIATDLSIRHIGTGAAKPIHPETGEPADPVNSLDQVLSNRTGSGGKGRAKDFDPEGDE